MAAASQTVQTISEWAPWASTVVAAMALTVSLLRSRQRRLIANSEKEISHHSTLFDEALRLAKIRKQDALKARQDASKAEAQSKKLRSELDEAIEEVTNLRRIVMELEKAVDVLTQTVQEKAAEFEDLTQERAAEQKELELWRSGQRRYYD